MAVDMQLTGKQAKAAALELRRFTTAQKNAALYTIADAIETRSEKILQQNAADMDDARAAGLSSAMLDRLNLTGRLPGIAADVRHVASLPDPVGEEFDAQTLPNGLQIRKRRVPIGVLGVIYEARPNVTVDVVALALKTSNAVILRGGSETLRSNAAIVDVIQDTLSAIDFPDCVVQLIRDSDRKYVGELLRLSDYVDMIIPRGGASLHKFCRENSSVPVITGGIGICHLYVDHTADIDKAVDVIYNAKVQRPSVCNALDTVLVQRSVADTIVPRIVERLGQARVHFKADAEAEKLVAGQPGVEAAGEGDWDVEWLDLILGIHVVEGLDEAIQHIQTHSTDHSDGILSSDPDSIGRFLNEIDSAAVYANASTRFTDGGQFGLGAEIAVSTQKLHARGPMGLQELTSYKWIVEGDGHVRP
ncbi:glutamate-5-semialdehyde dehydrogenase [Aggregatilinea lenta]|uniref:glutamate-5-semialdehyde dehydrogenase n=1 Tax=Aggregatilinea lenta TaxID=913108 RepID=UPI0013C2E2E5|nr:glutamate-5-semialdehyde dehydrogenase [Aggregatilinea lenta]